MDTSTATARNTAKGLIEVEEILARRGHEPTELIGVLQEIQERWHYLPEDALNYVATTLGMSVNTVFGVATFYAQFSLEPKGKYLVRICDGTACHVKGSMPIYNALKKKLDLRDGRVTTPDGLFTLETVGCIGACGIAPVMVVNEQVHSQITPEAAEIIVDTLMRREASDAAPVEPMAQPEARDPGAGGAGCQSRGRVATIDSVAMLNAVRATHAAARARHSVRVLVCTGTGCAATGAAEVFAALERAAAAHGGSLGVATHQEDGRNGHHVVSTGCRGLCAAGPLVHIEPSGVLYTHVTAADADEIVAATLRGEVVHRLVYRDPATGEAYDHAEESPFYRRQVRQVLAHCGNMDPESIEEYIALGGYSGLAKAVSEMMPEQVCEQVLASKLRGRGGAGFPAGLKWNLSRVEPATPKYVVCNGDEGDPGAFMNRSLMEGDPHRVLEGMIIAGYAIGASEGVFYVRAEYPLAVRRLRLAIAAAEELGLLGDDILGSGFSFRARIKEGAGAFVCGEGTALVASVEGKRGMPRSKPPFVKQVGLYGRPTVINNVETLGNVPDIITRGADWFRQLGTERSAGTKTFALTGKLVNTGLVEVPLGFTLRDMIFEIGGGIPNGKAFKAVQIGGPSGGCLPESQLDLSLDYDTLESAGAMVGSGGLVVIDEDNCIVEFARYFMQFIQNESCGKCVACREGTKQMLALLQKIVDGVGTLEDIDLLEELSCVVNDASLCGLGQTASNPVLSTLRYFRDEYEAHVRDRACPAHVCQAFRRFTILADKCVGCSRCAKACPAGAIMGQVKSPFVIDQDTCVRCGACVEVCRFDAVEER